MYNKTRYSRGIVSTLAGVGTLSNPKLGETCFCSENGRVMTYDGELWMCDDFVKATNTSGSTRNVGEIMIWKTTDGNTVEADITNSLATIWAGVVVYQSLNNAPVALAFKGIYKVDIIDVPATYDRLGFFARQASTNAKAALGTVVSSAGWFGWNVELLAGPGLTKCLLRGRPELK